MSTKNVLTIDGKINQHIEQESITKPVYYSPNTMERSQTSETFFLAMYGHTGETNLFAANGSTVVEETVVGRTCQDAILANEKQWN